MERRLKIEKHLILFVLGGMGYFFLEVLVRGYSHYTMFLCGGACFLCIGLLNESVKIKMSFISQMVLSTFIITGLELVTGLIVNVWLGWDIWDYSELPYNFKGQICLLYSVLWFFASSVAIVMDDFLRYKLFHEEKPHYKILWVFLAIRRRLILPFSDHFFGRHQVLFMILLSGEYRQDWIAVNRFLIKL